MKFILILGAIFIAGCGISNKSTSNSRERYINSSSGSPLPLLPATKQCTSTSGEFEYEINFEGISPIKVNVGTSNLTNLSPVISSIDYAGEKEYIEKVRTNRNFGRVRVKEISKPSQIKLCPNSKYQSGSYEDVALKASFVISQMFEVVKPIYQNFKPLNLKIAPIIHRTLIEKKGGEELRNKRILVSNALYSTSESAIIILPKGINEDGTISKSLWDVPLVTAHEFGHHITASLLNRDDEGFQKFSSGLCFDNRFGNMTVLNYGEENRKVSGRHIYKILDEAAADLFAYYGIDKNLHNLQYMPCLAMNRDVSSSTFMNGERKILDRQILANYFSEKNLDIKSCLLEVDYQDEHIIGAILANTIYNLLAQISISHQQKIKLLIDWLKEVGQTKKIVKKISNVDLIPAFLNILVAQLSNQYPHLNPKFCGIISNQTPIYLDKYSCN